MSKELNNCSLFHRILNCLFLSLSRSCSHQGPLAGSTPEPIRRYTTLPHTLVSRTSSAPSPSLQRRISTNISNSSYLKNKGRIFNIQLKKGTNQQ